MNKAGGSGSKFNHEDQIDQHRREQHRKHQLKYRRSRRERCKPITNVVYISRNIDNITSDSEVEDIENEHKIYDNNDSTDNINISSEEVDRYLSTHVIRSYDAHNMDELQLSDDEQCFSNVTRGNSDSEEEIDNNALSIANFIRKSNLNHSDTTHLLQLLRTIRFDEEIPRTENDLWNKLGVEFNFQSFVFCTSCSAKLVKFSDRCNCTASFKQINSELIVFSVSSALKNIIKQNIDLIDWYRQEDHQIVPDIVKDVLPLFKILGSIVEIPLPVREFQDNIMLFALWHSPSAPNANVFITDVINQIVQLQKNGLSIDLAAKGIHKFEIDVQLLVGDLPARAKVTRLNGHSGYFACSNCLYEGVPCPYHRHILYTWSDFCAAKPSVRTQEHIDWGAMRGEGSGKKVYGVHEASPLSRIMSIPIQCVYDYFHLIFEIHLTMLVKEWKLRLTQVNINYINKLLNDVSYPHSFNRKPKNFNLFNQWKASELRTFFLYLALPIIIRAQSALSDKIIYHFSLLFIYVRILRYFEDRYQIHDVKIFIEKYLQMFSTIYGRCHELLSTHVLLHLTEQCTRHGGLSYHSMFTFESQLHYLRKMAHGTTSLAQQIAFCNNYTQKQNGTSRKQYFSSQATTYRSQLENDDTGFDDNFDDECRYVGSTFTQRSSRQSKYNYSRQPTTTSRYANSPVQSPSVKRKHKDISVGEALILEKLDELAEQVVCKVAHGQNLAVPTNSSSSEPLEPVIFNDHNLLDDVDMNLKPTAFLCKLVRRLYTVQEIENGVAHDERMLKIKQAVRAAYYSNDFVKFDIFRKTQGHISVQGQKRSQNYRTRHRNDHVNLNPAQ
ncbi:unnamed protein product [Rotaria sp. Silwood1]|nr:unnamed protein product [Rotaria sp. Silwood1]